jgi:hypothetical protein
MERGGMFYGLWSILQLHIGHISWSFGIFFVFFGMFSPFWFIVSRKSGNPAWDAFKETRALLSFVFDHGRLKCFACCPLISLP